MPMVYSISLGTAGNSATNGSANTESNTCFMSPASNRSCGLQSFYVIGKGAGLTAISGIAFRLVRFTTASTAGTTVTPSPKDSGMQAAKSTVKSAGTTSVTGRTNRLVFGCGAAGPGGWVAPNPDSVEVVDTTTHSQDILNVSGTISLNYEWSGEICE